MKTPICTLCFTSILLAFAASSALDAAEVPAPLVAADNVIISIKGEDGKRTGYMANKNVGYVGNTGSRANMRNASVILGFKLPVLKAAPKEATLVITNRGASTTAFDWAAHLYVFAPGTNARALGQKNLRTVHYADSTPDESKNVRLLTDKFMVQKTPKGPVKTDLSRHFKKDGALAGFYGADGKPLPPDGMIWFRINQGEKPGELAIRINVDNTVGQEDSPSLMIATE